MVARLSPYVVDIPGLGICSIADAVQHTRNTGSLHRDVMPEPTMRGSVYVAAEEGKAERAGREVLMEISRSPSVVKERCSWQESPQKSPTSQCRPCPHKTLQVCGLSHCSPGYVHYIWHGMHLRHSLQTCRRAMELLLSFSRRCDVCLHERPLELDLVNFKGVHSVYRLR